MLQKGYDVRKPIVKVKGLWLRYRVSMQGDWVLRSLDFEVEDRETVLVIGASGSGKTSLIRALTGVAQAVFGAEVQGEIELCFKKLKELSTHDIQKCVQVVNQDPYTHFLEPVPLDDMLSYSERFYGNEAEEIVEKVVKLLDIEDIVNRPVITLSGGQLKRITIAKALIPNPTILIFDEPLMWLDDVNGVEMFKAILKTLNDMGKTIIIMEHRFLHLLNFVNSMYELMQGTLAKVDKSDVTKLVRQNFRRVVEGIQALKTSQSNSYREVLRLDNVWFKYGKEQWVLRDLNLKVYQGDTVVIYGPNGAGKSTLLRIIAGVLKPTKGSVKRFSKVMYIPQIPYLFLTEESIKKEIKELCNNRKVREDCFSRCSELLNRFGYDDLDRLPLHLSWGQVTRLATLLSINTINGDGLILLDEPFTGSTYLEAIALAETLRMFTEVAKIIVLSSRDYISLFPKARVYMLSNGVLSPLAYRDAHMFDKAAYRLMPP